MPLCAASTAAWMSSNPHRFSRARFRRFAFPDSCFRIRAPESDLQTTSEGPERLYFGTEPSLWFG